MHPPNFDDLKSKDRFIDIQWPAGQKPKPDPFSAEDRDKVLNHFREHEPYYPWVLVHDRHLTERSRGITAY